MASIFLGYERDELDQQYDLIGRFGDQYDVFCRLFESLSDQARAAFPSASLDIDCGDGLMIDFYPAAEPAAPVVLFLHGGLWRARGRRDFAMAATGLVPHGASVAIADGCLPQDVGPEAAVENARCAILWLRSHARSLGIDRERLFLLAHGLGAIPAAIALTTDWSLFGEGEEEIVTPVAGLA
ncbi:MAG: hypothetical protein HN577_06830, partial [Rhodospirillaceae bacterium]|nr:hypothetical protein [Rhodospirillaceae bacterium]